jgi:hypothetical protein
MASFSSLSLFASVKSLRASPRRYHEGGAECVRTSAKRWCQPELVVDLRNYGEDQRYGEILQDSAIGDPPAH